MNHLTSLGLLDARDGLAAGCFTAVALTQAFLQQIDQVEGVVQAFLHTRPEQALAEAEEADRLRAAGDQRPLLGIPLAIKDVLMTAGIETTAGSRMLQGFVPPYTATAIRKLQAAGAIVLGKTNTDEFAMGSSTENSGFAITRNPWDIERVPGGSSGGSAAAVAADETPAALGTDTGGSVRQPAALCGVVGLKPSYGRVSRYGLISYGSSLDQIGPITKTVADAALLLEVIAGPDPQDSTSLQAHVPMYTAGLTGDIAGMRLGIPQEYFVKGMQPQVEAAVHAAIEHMASLGAEIVPIHLPHAELALPVYYLVVTAEASANLARYDGVRFGVHVKGETLFDSFRQTRGAGFGPEVKRRIMLGTYALSAGYYDAYYLKAQQVRTLIKQDFDQAFAEVDVIVSPTSPTTAFRIGEKVDDPLAMILTDIFTTSANLAGLCGMSIPCGFDDTGLPIGLQLQGPSLAEEKILQAAHAYEQSTEWHLRRPDIVPLQQTTDPDRHGPDTLDER